MEAETCCGGLRTGLKRMYEALGWPRTPTSWRIHCSCKVRKCSGADVKLKSVSPERLEKGLARLEGKVAAVPRAPHRQEPMEEAVQEYYEELGLSRDLLGRIAVRFDPGAASVSPHLAIWEYRAIFSIGSIVKVRKTGW